MTLKLYILRRLVVSVLFAVGIILFVAILGISVATIQRMPVTDGFLLLSYMRLVLQGIIPYALPICFLLAVVSTYGQLAADKEWTAIQMAGFNPLSMVMPSILVALVLGGATYWVGAEIQPHAKKQQRQLIKKAAIQSLENLQPGRTTLRFKGFYLNAKYRDADEKGVFHVVDMRLPESVSHEKTDILADKVRIGTQNGSFRITAYGARTSLPGKSFSGKVDQVFYSVPVSELIPHSSRSMDHPAYLTSTEILDALATTQPDEKRERLMRFELHYRPAMACIFFVFALLGVATGLFMRNGNQLAALAVAIGYGLIYFVFSVQLGRDLGRGGEVPPWVGAWGVPIIGGLISVVTLKRSLKR